MQFNRIFRVGTRSSPLALKQVEEVLGLLREFDADLRLEVVTIDTFGDKDKVTPISDIEGTDFFTREIDDALLRGKIDFAVHSAKDLPDEIREGLIIAAITKPLEPYDCLVSKNNLKLKELPAGARIGASSARRKAQLKNFRPDLKVTDIRGNIQERLKKLKESDFDAIVVAICALMRLGLENMITERIPLEILKPHPLQGSLAVVARSSDLQLIKFLSKIDSRETVKI
ncbi:MAG: hydroxymethylbilane synthase [Candidatus Omnitrophota bacterium]